MKMYNQTLHGIADKPGCQQPERVMQKVVRAYFDDVLKYD